jgi:hypothetical protein
MRMRRFVILLSLLAVLVACNQGAPYAFRLMTPPSSNIFSTWLVPYWLWQEHGILDTFRACEEERRRLVYIPPDWESLPRKEQESLKRRMLAQCVPVR